MRTSVSLVDYQSGNLLSVARALEVAGAKVDLISTPAEIEKAQRLVLPGVGAFGQCMQKVKDANLLESIKNFCTTNKPFLGICVGMQMLFEVSTEFGEHQGLSLLPGQVKKMQSPKPIKIPYVGWAPLNGNHAHQDSPLVQCLDQQWVYLVHSFCAHPDDKAHLCASYQYGDTQITALVKHNALVGCQFHPEKSAQKGIEFLEQFLKM